MKKNIKIVHKGKEIKAKFNPCDEGNQNYSWKRTNRKATRFASDGPCGAYEVRKIEDVMSHLRKKKKIPKNKK